MPGRPPEGVPAPLDGRLPDGWAASRQDRPLGLYVHIPWCRSRCGYCDFNTYVLERPSGRATAPYLTALRAELALAARTLGERRVESVYFGGGTPTLLDPADFHALLRAIEDAFDLDAAAEITTEANPETLSQDVVARLRDVGVNRLSLGLQSTTPAVLRTLDRVHTPGRAVAAVAWARRAGFASVSLDLIYGTPGESLADWARTLDTTLAAQPDHVSAYALIVEDGTRLATRMAQGELPYPDDDDLADKYLLADERFEAAGRPWYEVSNWARPGQVCRHNLAYWRSDDWWGLGAGAHSHIAGLRWWNERHPSAYVARLDANASPAHARELLTATQRHTETVLLGLRLAEGLDPAALTGTERARLAPLAARGLIAPRGATGQAPIRLTPSGRLLADRVVADLLD
jgi:oxygen-independent coproporphyrinogen-3 oxidase